MRTRAASLALLLSITGSIQVCALFANNSHADPDDQCWTQWSEYWSTRSIIETSFTTYLTTEPSLTYLSLSTTSYATSRQTETIVEGNGNFPTKTYVTTITKSYEGPIFTVSTIAGVRHIFNTSDPISEHYTSTFALGSTTITPPPCQLASLVPQCQSSWENYVRSGGDGIYEFEMPPCTQASVTGSLCSTFLSNWLNFNRNNGGEQDGKVGAQWDPQTSNGTTVWPSSTTKYIWPTSSQIIPGCSPGCQSCRVSGSSVKLLYWPPATTTWKNGSFVALTRSISDAMTYVTDGSTLTSPTVYVSFDKLHASNSCSVIGSTLRNLIVAITDSATLSSLWGWDHYYGLQQTASFNFTDLYVTPVPDSIYNSQPRCASSTNSILYSCLPLPTKPPICETNTCARTLPYEPVIAIPDEVRHLQPAWSDCIGGIIGVYDPPSALQAAASAAMPTMPVGMDSSAGATTSQAEISPITRASPSSSPTGVAPLTWSPVDPQHTEATQSPQPEKIPQVASDPPHAPSGDSPHDEEPQQVSDQGQHPTQQSHQADPAIWSPAAATHGGASSTVPASKPPSAAAEIIASVLRSDTQQEDSASTDSNNDADWGAEQVSYGEPAEQSPNTDTVVAASIDQAHSDASTHTSLPGHSSAVAALVAGILQPFTEGARTNDDHGSSDSNMAETTTLPTGGIVFVVDGATTTTTVDHGGEGTPSGRDSTIAGTPFSKTAPALATNDSDSSPTGNSTSGTSRVRRGLNVAWAAISVAAALTALWAMQ